MKLFSEESRTIYSDAFPHALTITALGNTNLAGLRVQTLVRAPRLDGRALEARRAVRLACWLAQYGSIWPVGRGAVMSEFGPFPFPMPSAVPALSPEELARVAVEAAGSADGDLRRVFEDLIRRRFFRRAHVELEDSVRNDPELEDALRAVQVPVACSPLREITLGQVFDALQSLHIVRRLVPGAVFTAAGVQTVRSFLEGDLMMALGYATAGTVATLVLHVAKPAETFSDAFAREIAASSSAPALSVDEPSSRTLTDRGEAPPQA